MKKITMSLALFAALAFGTPVVAAQCELEIESNDAMKFNLSSITVPKGCVRFTVNLKHVGKLPKTAMGHNWVLSKTADVAAAASDAIAAGVVNDYLKPGDVRIIAASKLIGGGETTKVSFDVAKLKADESYTYFCSFPGHATLMKGRLELAK